MKEISGNIFNIQKYSIHDGYGIRTTVFLKGCPLSCKWCHNPESLSIETQVIMYEDRCILCGRCVEVCPVDALTIKNDQLLLDKNKCNLCGECEKVCLNEAIELVGKRSSIEEVMAEIDKDKVFYETSGGGVTFSGGEPFMQAEFLEELTKQCKIRNYHVAIDTSGMTNYENIERVLKYTNLFLFDLKLMDNEKHKQYIGASNQTIIDNLKRLSKEDVEIFIRLPLIRGINDSNDDIDRVLELIEGMKNISQVNLLEYHSMGKEKYNRLGMEYIFNGDEKPGEERISEIEQKFKAKGFKTVIGG